MKRADSCFSLGKSGEKLSIFLTISAGFYLDETSGSLLYIPFCARLFTRESDTSYPASFRSRS
jgi:hypothetical protein